VVVAAAAVDVWKKAAWSLIKVVVAADAEA
jgi:hypothetical protein